MIGLVEIPLLVLAWLVLLVGLIQNLIYASYLIPAWRELRDRANAHDDEATWQALRRGDQPPITLIVPAYNEDKSIVANAHSLLSLRYSGFQVIIVNDGSTDETMTRLADALELVEIPRAPIPGLAHAEIRAIYRSAIYPNLCVVDKENGGKADAINAGLACTRTELFCVIDADSILQPEALVRAVQPFQDPSENVVAVGGTVGVANGCLVKHGQIDKYALPREFIARVQTVEYTRAFLLARLALSRTNTLTLVSGAFGVFSTRVVIGIGGFDVTTVGEDMELIMRLHHRLRQEGTPYSMRYLPEPVCWTEVPSTLRGLSRQRIRWQRGAMESLSRHRGMILNPRYGRIGLVALPSMIIIDVLGPVVEVLGYFLVPALALWGILDLEFLFAYLALTFGFGIFLSTASIVLEQGSIERPTTAGQLLSLAWTAVLENFGYRQLNNLWRLTGLLKHFSSAPAQWGDVGRTGFREEDAS